MRRSRMDIIIDVLEVAKVGANKTSIVYRTNLNFKMAEKYLDWLQEHSMMANRLDKYITTEKGNGFIEKVKSLNLYLENSNLIM